MHIFLAESRLVFPHFVQDSVEQRCIVRPSPRPPPIFALYCTLKTTAASAFSAMKNNPKANTRSKDNHLRKGGAGGWRDSWTVRESEEFNKIYREQMAGSGLDFDFGEVGSFKLEQ